MMKRMGATDVILSWSGGKDSTMALRSLRQDASYRVAYLLTTVTDHYDRISIHGVRRTLLRQQARALGLDLFEVVIPPTCTNDVYQQRMVAALTSPSLNHIRLHAFADLFLEDVRAYREENLTSLDRRAVFPLWGRDTVALAREFIALGYRALLVCIDTEILEADFAGREFDQSLLDELPEGVDPCGENGEFHTFVYDGPGFASPIRFERGDTVVRDGFAFKDLVEV